MKKSVLVCAALLVSAVLVSAPAAAATKFNFGVKAGVSLANNVWSNDDGSEKTLIRPTFGVFAVMNLTPMIAIQPEVNYLTMGESWDDVGETISETFNYLHIPVLIKARLMQEGSVIPVVFAGPAVGFLLSADETGYGSIKEYFKSTDFGLDFGAGAEMAAGNMKLLLDARYYLGLTDVFDPPILATMTMVELRMKNRGFLITVGLIF